MGWAAVDTLERPYETGLDLWLAYTTAAFEGTQGRERAVVFYEDLLDDPDGRSERLAAFAGLSERLTQETRDEIRAFLRPPRVRHGTSTDSPSHPEHPAHAEIRSDRKQLSGVVFGPDRATLSVVEKRFLVVLAVAAVAVVVVGLSTAATMSRGESKQPARAVQPESNATSVQPATKAASKAGQKNKASSPAVTSSERSQSAKDVESYWTKERMDDAQPMEKTRPGGSPSSSPAPSGSTAPGSTPTKSPNSQTSRTKSPKSTADTGVVTSPAATPNPGYWDDEAMSGAQPLDKTRPGGSGSASSEPSGPTAPGSPPS